MDRRFSGKIIQVVWFEGNYQDYDADRHRRLGAAADQPHRIKYKPLRR